MNAVGGFGVAVLVAAGLGCGGPGAPAAGWRCAEAQAHFPPASTSVDRSKKMSELTTDERTAACAEFSRALTDSFGTLETGCKLGSHGPREGQATCPAWYDDCLQMTPRIGPINGCTEKMSGMWTCPITIGQYEDCFNDTNSTLLALIETPPPCTVIDENTCGPRPPSPACMAAACDYGWFD